MPPILPPVVQRPTPNYSPVLIRHNLLILHMMEGGYAGSVAWLCQCTAKASAHLCMSENGDEVSQLVPLSMKAWGQMCIQWPRRLPGDPGFHRAGRSGCALAGGGADFRLAFARLRRPAGLGGRRPGPGALSAPRSRRGRRWPCRLLQRRLARLAGVRRSGSERPRRTRQGAFSRLCFARRSEPARGRVAARSARGALSRRRRARGPR